MTTALQQILVEQAAPTLAGIKPASLFPYQPATPAQAAAETAELDRFLVPFGLRARLLKQCRQTGRMLLYVYRERALGDILAQPEVRAFLAGKGYTFNALAAVLEHLSGRLCLNADFPHEIGVFLGYPLEDVKGFIANRGHNFTCCGCWKVYGDPAAAKLLFARFERCTEAYCRSFARGTPLSQLALAG